MQPDKPRSTLRITSDTSGPSQAGGETINIERDQRLVDEFQNEVFPGLEQELGQWNQKLKEEETRYGTSELTPPQRVSLAKKRDKIRSITETLELRRRALAVVIERVAKHLAEGANVQASVVTSAKGKDGGKTTKPRVSKRQKEGEVRMIANLAQAGRDALVMETARKERAALVKAEELAPKMAEAEALVDNLKIGDDVRIYDRTCQVVMKPAGKDGIFILGCLGKRAFYFYIFIRSYNNGKIIICMSTIICFFHQT